jgi:hypothetical protein
VQAQKTIEDLSGKLESLKQWWTSLWSSFRSIAKALWTPKDADLTWAEFFPFLPARLQDFLRRSSQALVRSVLAHFWVLYLDASLEKVVEDGDQEF